MVTQHCVFTRSNNKRQWLLPLYSSMGIITLLALGCQTKHMYICASSSLCIWRKWRPLVWRLGFMYALDSWQRRIVRIPPNTDWCLGQFHFHWKQKQIGTLLPPFQLNCISRMALCADIASNLWKTFFWRGFSSDRMCFWRMNLFNPAEISIISNELFVSKVGRKSSFRINCWRSAARDVA